MWWVFKPILVFSLAQAEQFDLVVLVICFAFMESEVTGFLR